MEKGRVIPPHDTEAEQAVLTSMLFDKDAVSLSSEMIKEEDFYSPANGMIFSSMISLFEENEPVDIVTLKNKLVSRGVLEQVGGMEYLSNLVAGYYTAANVKEYAKIVADKSTLRKLIKISTEITDSGYKAEEPVSEILENAEKRILEIGKTINSQEFFHVKDIVLGSVAKIEAVYTAKSKITGIETGFSDFDYKTAGLQSSDLILIAARPSMGKTAFALNIAQYASMKKQIPTAIFSLEMSKEQLVSRMLCSEALIDAQKIRTGDLADADWGKLVEAMGTFSEAQLYIDDTPGISVAEIRAKCRRLKAEKGLGLIVIDYLQLMSGRGRTESRQQEISEISRSLKAIAREMDSPVVALSQLSRACEMRADHRPMLSDLRESGAIEQDADIVSFLYRDEYYNDDSDDKGLAEIIIAKQRNGPTGTVKLRWFGEYTKFTNLEY